MFEIPFARPLIGEEEKKAVLDVLNGNILVHGPHSRKFEEDFARWTNAPASTCVSSCTAAMHLAYFCWGVGPGDEVIVPAQTHTATAHAVELSGAKPVFVDAELQTGNMDTNLIEQAITKQTKAIALVHYLGVPADMDAIMAIANRHGLKVLEDCALSIGAKYKGIHTGLIGDIGCFSFYPVKHMTTAEGGMAISRHNALITDINHKKAFGVDRSHSERKTPGEYDVTDLGFNYRMNEIEAALGIQQLKRVDSFLDQRRKNYNALAQALSKYDHIETFSWDQEACESGYYCYSVLLQKRLSAHRNKIIEKINGQGIGTSIYYPKPVPHMTYYRDKYGFCLESFPNAHRISATSIALPVGPHLKETDMECIASCLGKTINEIL